MGERMGGPGPRVTLRNHGRTLNSFELEGTSPPMSTRYALPPGVGTGNFFVCPFVVHWRIAYFRAACNQNQDIYLSTVVRGRLDTIFSWVGNRLDDPPKCLAIYLLGPIRISLYRQQCVDAGVPSDTGVLGTGQRIN